MRDEEFVMRYFTLQGLDKKDAQKVREVVVVTHQVLLSDLLADGNIPCTPIRELDS